MPCKYGLRCAHPRRKWLLERRNWRALQARQGQAPQQIEWSRNLDRVQQWERWLLETQITAFWLRELERIRVVSKKSFVVVLSLSCFLVAVEPASGDCAMGVSTAHVMEVTECYSQTSPFSPLVSEAEERFHSQIEGITNGKLYVVLGGRRISEAIMNRHGPGEWGAPSEEGPLFLYVNPGKNTDCPLLKGVTLEIEQTPKCCDTPPFEACRRGMHYGEPIRGKDGCWKGVVGGHCWKVRGRKRSEDKIR